MTLLTLFLMRLASGLSLGMALVSPKLTPSGFFRNQLYVALGLCTVGTMLARAVVPEAFYWALGATALSYLGAVAWLYEKPRLGLVALTLVGLTAFAASCEASRRAAPRGDWQASAQSTPSAKIDVSSAGAVLWRLQGVGSTALLGAILAAMLLGHWRLNAPGMSLAPLLRLTCFAYAALALHGSVCAAGLGLTAIEGGGVGIPQWRLFVVLRWLFGLIGAAILVWMTRQTLRIPNTQSATGILYVAVIGIFGGEIVSMLLSAHAPYPL